MGRYVGLDLGTTTITGLVLDTESAEVVSSHTADNDAELTSADDRARGRSEWDIDRMIELSRGTLSALAAEHADTPVAALGITGQMHGMLLLDAAGQPSSPFIGWQDQRCEEQMPSGETYLERMCELGGEGFGHSGCPPATGYMGATLFWLAHNDLLPATSLACFAPDYLVSRLCETRPVTDPTNAASAGLFDVTEGSWNSELLANLRISAAHLPEVRASCEVAGGLSQSIAAQTGWPSDLAVAVACGDNQASFAGSVADYARSVLVNIGTGGQVSAYVEHPLWPKGLDLRPALGSGFLLVGAPLCGGRSYRILRDFMTQVGTDLFDVSVSAVPDVYERLTRLARAIPPGADGLRCEPLFAGSRQQPERRAVWSGMSETNFTPGHMARALLEGLAAQFHLLYQHTQQAGAGAREILVGSGNGIRKNPLLREILARSFDLPLTMVSYSEEAAVGAALCAAVAVGEFPDIEEASRSVIGQNYRK